MPDLSLKDLDESLMRAVRVEAAKADLTQRDFVIRALSVAVGWVYGVNPGSTEAVRDTGERPRIGSFMDSERYASVHDVKTCRVYGCLMCAAVKESNG